MFRFTAGLALSVILAQATKADDPSKKVEQLPPPREVPAAPVVIPQAFSPATTFVRENRWDVWQHYGVNRWGYYRPRVAYSPFGSYYLFDGQPYPFDQAHPRWWLMNVAGTPNRLPPAYMPYVED